MSAKKHVKKEKFLEANFTKEEAYENYKKRKDSNRREKDKKQYEEYWN